MYSTRRLRLRHVLPRSLMHTFIHATPIVVVYVLYHVLGYHNVAIPMAPVTIIGTAVAFYVGFKNNSSYDRLWEARRIWGSITNASRTWAALVTELLTQSHIPSSKETARQMVLRHIGWCNVLRLQLRRNKVWGERYYQSYTAGLQHKIDNNFADAIVETLDRFCNADEKNFLLRKQNIATHLLHLQIRDVKRLRQQGAINELEFTALANVVTDLYNQQGACERIKGYPFPRQYAVFSRVFVDIFVILLPFGLMPEIMKVTPGQPWLLFPICFIVAWVFNAMEQIGDLSENPFENALTDIPMTAMCRNIEIDLREMIGDTDIPERIQPVDGILM